jgi:hypothetical protein
MFLNLQKNSYNKDDVFEPLVHLDALNKYLWITKDWDDPYPEPVIKEIDGFRIIDESVIGDGSKARFGDLLFQKIKQKKVVYCQPRYGWAGISLCHLAERYKKELILFMPACKEASDHQLVTIEKGAKPIFKRIASMPNLNRAAKDWASKNNAFFIPLGLKHELVTAAIVRVAYDLFRNYGYTPHEMWTVISTGVLSRGLQIALPQTKFYAVAVARNIQQGELGRAKFLSYEKPFAYTLKESPVPGINSALNYDAKGLEFFDEMASPGAYFWNVAGEIRPKKLKPSDIKSDVPWTK